MQQRHMAVKAVIVMPTTTPLNQSESVPRAMVQKLFSKVMYMMKPANMHISWQKRMDILLFIHLMTPTVATGQGTIAMEIFKELPLVDIILVPIGGGGLATGVSTLAKLLNPKIKVIGVEPAGAELYAGVLKEG